MESIMHRLLAGLFIATEANNVQPDPQASMGALARARTPTTTLPTLPCLLPPPPAGT